MSTPTLTDSDIERVAQRVAQIILAHKPRKLSLSETLKAIGRAYGLTFSSRKGRKRAHLARA